MKEIKCLAFDVDGTLTNDKGEIDICTKQSIQEAINKGIHIIISSGRNKKGCEFVYEPLGLEKGNHFLSLVNGQQIYDFKKEKYYYDKQLYQKDISTIGRICRKYKCVIRYTLEDEVIYSAPIIWQVRFGVRFIFKKLKRKRSMTKGTKYKQRIVGYKDIVIDKPVNKIVLMASPSFFDKNFLSIKQELHEYEVMKVGKDWIEVMPKDVNKAKALEKIASMNGFTLENIMAFGDAENDISMLKACGVGVAMGNALDNVKEIANIITDSNNENGIGKVIDQMILGK